MKDASRRVPVNNVDGVNMRAAVLLCEDARLFPCALRITCEGRAADAKNVWEMLGLRAECGSELFLEAQGPQSKQAVDCLAAVHRPLQDVRPHRLVLPPSQAHCPAHCPQRR
jgi:phosphocarrier protein HPr